MVSKHLDTPFHMELLPGLQKLNRTYKSSAAGKARKRASAEELMDAGFRWFRLKEKDVADLAGGDLRRVAIAWAVFRLSCASQKWIAEKLSMKSAPNVSQQIKRFESRSERDLPKAVAGWRKKILKQLR